jgi:hypothetical protein
MQKLKNRLKLPYSIFVTFLLVENQFAASVSIHFCWSARNLIQESVGSAEISQCSNWEGGGMF